MTIEPEELFQVNRVDLVLLSEADPFLCADIIAGELLFTDDPEQLRCPLQALISQVPSSRFAKTKQARPCIR